MPYYAQHAVVLYSGHNPRSLQSEVPLCVTLHVGVGVCHGCNQHVKQDDNHDKQEDEVQQHTKPPAWAKTRPSMCVALLNGWWYVGTVEGAEQ